ncbi:AfsR/SARP family transcriptional regulator [Mycolicibacterium celeriflavum]|uniref:AfsR/SARP family transcriptional regulator n=1 Tax=Mycolicibacterium celeriflavum TaxID=1249101 RepID=UPI003CF9F7FA
MGVPRAHAEVTLLGGFGLTYGGCEVVLPMGGQRLVAILALRGRMSRSRLAGALRPETTEQRAHASLRTGIWRVNQAASGLVVARNGQVGLDARARVDVAELVRRSVAVMGGEELDVPMLYPGELGTELLPDWDDPWLTDERERLRQLRLHMLERVADRLTVAGQFGLAIEVAFSVLQADMLRESAHRALVRAHLAEGNVVEARRAYAACELLLNRELGVAPTVAMTGLLASIGGASDAGVTGM